MTDDVLLQRALEFAERGRGYVEPNPLVGAVIVRDGKILGEGWHEKYGQAHAEINALKQAGESARGATLYVTLEPCCHHGKTPPCTDAVIRAGIRRVVASMLDPFPAVAGKGLAVLREAGVETEVGLGGPAAHRLNAPYLTLLRAGRPWIHGKWAMTLDGKIASFSGSSKWITSEAAREKVHKLRGLMDAILIGRGTLLADDPLLTARPPGPRIPTRIVVTSGQESLPDDCQLLRTIDRAPVMLLTTKGSEARFANWANCGAEVIGFDAGADGRLRLHDALQELGRRRMTNVLIEGGGGVLGALLDERLIDEVHAFVAPKLIGGSEAASPIGGRGIELMGDALRLNDVAIERLGDDILINARIAGTTGPQ